MGGSLNARVPDRAPVLEHNLKPQTTHPLGVANPDGVLVLWRHWQTLDQGWRQHVQRLPHQRAPPIWLARSQESHKHLQQQSAWGGAGTHSFAIELELN